MKSFQLGAAFLAFLGLLAQAVPASSKHWVQKNYPPHQQCGFAPPSGKTMQDVWISTDVDTWLNKEMEYFYGHPAEFEHDSNFMEYLVKEYAGDMLPSAFGCNVLQTCQPIGCHEFGVWEDPNSPRPDNTTREMNAYHVIEAIANLNNFMNLLHQGSDMAVTNMGLHMANFDDHFSNKAANYKSLKRIEEEKKTMAHAFGAGIAILTAMFGIVVSPLPVLDVLGAEIGATVLAGTLAGVMTGVDSGVTSLYFDEHGSVQDPVPQDHANFGDYFAEITAEFNKRFISNGMDLLTGKQIKNVNLGTILQNGVYSGLSVSAKDITTIVDQFMTYWSAIAINHVWMQQYTYIMETENLFGCYSDDEGPSWLKVCLDGEEYAKKTYYVYTISDKDQNGEESLVMSPTGFDHLADYGLTLKDVVASSVAWDKVHGLSKPGVDPIGDFANFLSTGSPSAFVSHPGSFPGLFRIPICKSAYGELVSSVNTRYNRNFPCMCGVGYVRTNDGHGDRWSGTDDQPAFLDATGLKYSRGFADTCKKDMKCKEDKSQSLNDFYERPDPSGWNPATNLKYPFKKCEDPQDERIDNARIWGHTLKGEAHFVVQAPGIKLPYNWRSSDLFHEARLEAAMAGNAEGSSCDGTENGYLDPPGCRPGKKCVPQGGDGEAM